jgi:hypothetical protein
MSDNPEMFAIVPYTGRPPEESIIIGNLSQVTEYIPQSVARVEAEQRVEEQAAVVAKQQDANRAAAEQMAQIIADRVARLSGRIDAYETRRQEREDQLRRWGEAAEAAAAEAKANEEYSLPYPDAPDAETALKDSTPGPSGEIHSVGPVDKEHWTPRA